MMVHCVAYPCRAIDVACVCAFEVRLSMLQPIKNWQSSLQAKKWPDWTKQLVYQENGQF